MEVRISNHGVPHLIIDIDNVKYSACYFGRSNIYRVWEWETQKKIGDISIKRKEIFNLEDKIKSLIYENKTR